MKPPPEKEWLDKWTEHDVGRLLSLAEGNRAAGAINDRAAWIAAERQYFHSRGPYVGRQTR